MSSISSPDSSLSKYYQNQLKHLEKEKNQELRAEKKAYQRDLQRRSDLHEKELLQKEKEREETVESVREDFYNRLSSTKNKYQVELERLKERKEEDALDKNQSQYRHYQDTFKALEQDKKRVLHQSELDHQKKIQQLGDRYQKSFVEQEEKAYRMLKEGEQAARVSHQLSKDQSQAEIHELQRQLQGAKADLRDFKNVPKEIFEKQIQDAKEAEKIQEESWENRWVREKGKNAQRMHHQDLQNREELQRAQEKHDLEKKVLRNQLKEFSEGTLQGNRNEGKQRAELQKQHETQSQQEALRLSEMYDEMAHKLQSDLRRQGHQLQERHQKNLKEKEQESADRIQKMAQEQKEQLKDFQRRDQIRVNASEDLRKKDAARFEVNTEKNLRNLESQFTQSHEKQAEAYQATLSEMKKRDQALIGSLQEELQKRKTAIETQSVSPAAEQAIRNRLIQDYEKRFEVARENQNQEIDQVQKKYSQHYYKALSDHETKETKTHQENEQQRALDRSHFFEALQDTMSRYQQALKSEESLRERELEKVYRQFTHLLEKQRQNFEVNYENARTNADGRLKQVKQESLLQAQLAHRKSAQRQQEIIQGYEKKLAQQKLFYELELSDMKAKAQIDFKKQEQRSKQEWEQLQNSNRIQLSQLKEQAETKEKRIHQAYQDEMEKLKQNDVFLNKKKS